MFSRSEASGSYCSIRLSIGLTVSSLLLAYRLKIRTSLRAHEERGMVERARILRTTGLGVESLLARVYEPAQTIMRSPTSLLNHAYGA